MATIPDNIKELWSNADAICFDVDSTVCTGEAIDDFAAFLGIGDQVAELTRRAMGEGLSFRQSLDERLKLMKPSKQQLDGFIETHPLQLTPGVKKLVSKLHERKKDVYLVSGGFRSFIAPVAKKLNIPLDNLFTNIFIFNDDGSYGGFDKDQPTSSSGGKKVVATKLKTEKGYKSLVMIGDGVTDLEAYPPADLFIGFGGNKIRENVRQNSPWFVTQFQELIDVL
eukprot:TCONS_00005587-protein